MTMAFQPIVDARARTVFAYEALVRGAAGEPAEAILSQVNPDNRYAYDQTCRCTAVALAARLQMPCYRARASEVRMVAPVRRRDG